MQITRQGSVADYKIFTPPQHLITASDIYIIELLLDSYHQYTIIQTSASVLSWARVYVQ